MSLEQTKLKEIIEAALFSVGEPLSLARIQGLFLEGEQPSVNEIKAALELIKAEYETRIIQLKEIASGYTFQVKQEYSPWIQRLWEEKPAKYSRATLETLIIIAYRQPITRAEIEEIRGVAVSSHIMKSLLERNWIRVVGHRDVPGKPGLYATTKAFLDYFNLTSLDDLPALPEIQQMAEEMDKELDKKIAEIKSDNLELPFDDTQTTESSLRPERFKGIVDQFVEIDEKHEEQEEYSDNLLVDISE